jgi:sortase A
MGNSEQTLPQNPPHFGAGFGVVVDHLRTRPAARRALSAVSILTALLALGLLAYPFATNLRQHRLQSKLAIEFNRPGTRQAYQAGRIAIGEPLTLISIPAIGLKPTVVVEGTGASALRAGVGHYPATPLPGEEGNVAIAGHRTTYGKPFADLDRLRPGDEIRLVTPLATYIYRVVERRPGAQRVTGGAGGYVVDKSDFSPLAQGPGRMLTLSTCHPKGSARQRLIVKAELIT